MLDRALAVGEQLVAALREHPASERVELAGSARRMADSVKDLDVIATATDPRGAGASAAAALELVEPAGTPARPACGCARTPACRSTCKIVAPDQFGNLLQHFTGSKEHNMALRDAAVRKGLHVSEYGVLDDATGETHRCATEAEVYALLGLEYIEPELRENRGELEAAAAGTLPELIERRTICAATSTATRPPRTGPPRSRRWRSPRGTPATSTWRSPTTRRASASATTSRPSGCASRSSGSAPPRSTGSSCSAGSEVNILPDGSLDYEDDVLAELDWVIASVHSSFRMALGGDDGADRARDRASAGRRASATRPGARSSGGRRTRSTSSAVIEAAARTGHDARDQREPRPP